MNKIFLTVFFLFSIFKVFAQPPACTNTLVAGGGVQIVNAGQVFCVPPGSAFSGSFLVNSGGHVVICVGSFTGGVTIQPGGTLWDSPSVSYIGSLAVFGTRNSNAANCVTCSAPSSGTLTTPNAICSGSSSGIDGSAVSSVTYEWQRENTLNANNWVVIGGNTEDLAAGTIGNLTTTTRFRRRTSACSPVQTSAWVTVTITVDPATVAGTISSAATVCSGSNSGTLTLSGHTGSVVRWESSTNGGGSWSSLANTTTSQAYNNLTTTTQYRAVVQSGACSAANTPAVTITVDPATVAGTISSAATVCSGSNSGTLTLSGHTGSLVRWESSTNGGGSWSTITNTTTSQAYNNLTTTTQYRAVVQSGGCSEANSPEVIITVNALPSIASLVGVEDSICGPGTVNISVTGVGAGETIDWYADATGGSVLAGGSATANYTTPSINTSTTYYAELRNSTTGCVSSARIPVEARVNTVPTTGSLVGVEDSICGSGSVNISVTGVGAGETIDWYADGTGGSVLAGGSATANYTTPSINTTTTYYAELRNSTTGCVSSARIPVEALVNSLPSNNLIAIEGDTCGEGMVNISVTGANVDETVDWYANATGGEVLTDGLGVINFTTPIISSNTIFYAQLRNDISGCISVNRTPVRAIIHSFPVINLGPDVTICPGVSHGLELFGYDSVRWSTSEITDQIVIAGTQKVDVLAIDANGCMGRDTIQITSVPNPMVKLMNDTTICELEQQVIDISAENSEWTVLWNTGSSNKTISVNYPGVFIVEVTDINKCSAKDTVIIAPYCRPISITMPNVFTPNNDGVNDNFNPLELSVEDKNYMLLNIKNIHFEVYNRWGQKIHGSTETLPNWNGFSDLGGIAPTGAYFWVLDYELINGEQNKKNGYVQLVGK